MTVVSPGMPSSTWVTSTLFRSKSPNWGAEGLSDGAALAEGDGETLELGSAGVSAQPARAPIRRAPESAAPRILLVAFIFILLIMGKLLS